MSDSPGAEGDGNRHPVFGADVEFEDEPPGAYLEELRAGRWSVGWGLLNLGLAAVVASVWFAGNLGPGVPARLPAQVVWALLPVSAILAFIVSGWLLLVEGTRPATRLARWSVGLSIISLGVWIGLRYGFGVFADG